jgi:uncharacterized protein (DUF58 family)
LAASAVAEFLAPEFLARLERLSLAARRSFRARLKGERRSLKRGHSVEFFDYRPYGIGDDLRYVDWNIFGRLDRLYLKLFLDEEDLLVHLIIDGSASMGFGGKLTYATRLAAALGFVGLANSERVGAGILRGRVAQGWGPTRGRSHFVELVEFLARLRATGTTGVNEGLTEYARRAREPGLAIVISDLLDPAGYEMGLGGLAERRFDVCVLHVLAPEEASPGFGGDLRLIDSESGEARELTLDGEALHAYQSRLREFLERAERFCSDRAIGYRRVTTDTPVEEFMLAELKGLVLA